MATFGAAAQDDPKPVACIVTEYRHNSHADVIVGKILEGYDQKGGPGPALRVASLFTDQVPAGDLSRQLAGKHKFPIVENIEQALTLGRGELAVEGVLLIGEHGDYPYNVKGQHCYPRLRFFEDTAAVFRKLGRLVPVFNDKHLAYSWPQADWIYRTSRELKVPFLAGSSLPLTYRRPALSLPMGCELAEALVVGYSGLESYGFHALETLQCMVERRQGGETGVAAVQALRGDSMFRALDEGRWSRELLDAVLKVIPHKPGRVEDNCRDHANAAVYLLEYTDGLRAAVAMLSGHVADFGFAAQVKDQPQAAATWFFLKEPEPFPHFAWLVKAIERLVHTGRPPYPVERTLLTTGVLDAAMSSLFQGGTRIETPHLSRVSYQPTDYPFAPRPDVGIDFLKDS
ncbi:MAG: hypothetical protein KY476_03480 [Planctomycetes bacterium]|nr:hypothetical protein [Planctomycetota bacterium]